jgi:hypothetical protein
MSGTPKAKKIPEIEITPEMLDAGARANSSKSESEGILLAAES